MHSPALSSPRLSHMMLWQLLQRIGPLGVIILLHIGFFYTLQSGLLRQAAQLALPKTVYASFITPEPPKPAETPKPQPAPKTVPVVKKAVTPPPVVPAVNNTPSERAIAAPPAPPTTPEPVAAAAPPAPPAPAAPAQPRVVSSGIEYIQPPQPEYPPASRRMSEEGKVVLRILVNERGRPERAEIQASSGSPRLDEAARQAAMRAVFKPHIEDGRPITVFAILPIRFQLDS